MAYKRDITDRDQVFFGTDRLLRYTIYEGNPTAAEIAAGTVTPADIEDWDLVWVLRKKPNTPDPPLIEKINGAGIEVVGTWNADPLLNTQRAEVRIDDTDTYDPEAVPEVNIKPGTYAYALKRLDAGQETVLAYGSFVLLQAAAW